MVHALATGECVEDFPLVIEQHLVLVAAAHKQAGGVDEQRGVIALRLLQQAREPVLKHASSNAPGNDYSGTGIKKSFPGATVQSFCDGSHGMII